MMNYLLTLDALSIASSKQLSFPLTLTCCQRDFHHALTTTWQIVSTLRRSLGGFDVMHGKLLLADFNEDISAESGQFTFQCLADGQVQLDVQSNVQLIFDFQSTLWQRLEAVSSTLDYLQQLCQLQSTELCRIALNNP